MKRRILILVLVGSLCLMSQPISAQISEGGTPISFSLDFGMGRDVIPVLRMPSVNAKALIEEDEKRGVESNIPRPFRFGYAIDVDIDIKKVGMRIELSCGGNLWLMKIHCPDAYSINLIYDRFWLSEGSRFFIYNEDRSVILGAFTPEVSNNESNVFATDLLQGNTIILEYYEPKSSDDGVIRISTVVHGYVNTFSSGLDQSAWCNIDINCPLGNDWRDEQRSVALLLVSQNTSFCTGVLVNNTRQNNTPYILTARHCYFGDNNHGGTPDRNPATSIFRFLYWRPNCSSGNPSGWVSITGATLRAQHRPTDMALLQLNSTPPSSWDVYYAGWDRTDMPAQSTTAIHHPQGDVMKISRGNNPAFAVAWPGHSPISTQTHWRVFFHQGIVQHGSSGSPLFNQNRRIIGQLHGNQNNQCGYLPVHNDCHCAQWPIGEYGRFDLSWNGGWTNSTRLSNWLDPDNTGVFTLDGYYCTESFSNQTINTNTTITSTCPSLNVQTVTINSGTVTIFARDEVILRPEFWAKSGSNVTITVSGMSTAKSLGLDSEDEDTLEDIKTHELASDTEPENEEIASQLELPDLFDFNLYPNPTDGNFSIELTNTDATSFVIEIFNAFSGALVSKTQSSANPLHINRSDLPNGTYLVRVSVGDDSLTKRLVLQK